MNKCVEIKNYKVKIANKTFSVVEHEFELVLNVTAGFAEIEDSVEYPNVSFHFIELENIETHAVDTKIGKFLLLVIITFLPF